MQHLEFNKKPVVSLKSLPLAIMLSAIIFLTLDLIITAGACCFLNFMKIETGFFSVFIDVSAVLFLFFIAVTIFTVIYFIFIQQEKEGKSC